MNERDIKVLKSIRRYALQILDFVSKCESKEDFVNDAMICSACSFNLLQIGELAKQQLSDEARKQTGSIPWEEIYGLRNRIVHGYEGINFTTVWAILTEDVPELCKTLSEILNGLN